MDMWPVVPLCNKQLLDVDKEDILNDGLFRKCNTYKSGGGYDKLPYICEKRLGKRLSNQFVVQLRGCHLKCWYCYVTADGIWSDNYEVLRTGRLMQYFVESGQDILHLMGGAPALYINSWHELIDTMPREKVFHSDLTLTEGKYNKETLRAVSRRNCLYAVNIKGVSEENYAENTLTKLDTELMWDNLDKVVESNMNFYLTFTNPDKSKLDRFKSTLISRYGRDILEDSFVIDIIKYKALGDV